MNNKALMGLASFLLFLAKTASAFPFAPAAMVSGYITPGGAEASACNAYYSVPLQCAVMVRGMYPNGFVTFSQTNMLLFPGMCDYAFLNAGYVPFVQADATAQCVFALQ
ncbi:MAG: hypothetical protein ACJ763_19675 [Bdellovibrionia bacterium]